MRDRNKMMPLGVAVIGVGYWGPNLVRNFQAFAGSEVRWVCDVSREAASRAIGPRSSIKIAESLVDVLSDPGVDAVAIATPAASHAEIALSCLAAGKHVLIEKPLSSSVAEGEQLVAMANDRGLTLMCDHTYCYTPAVKKIKELMHTGALGDLQYFDAVRVNLGLIQPDIDVFWDLASHDLSILDYVLPDGCVPEAVAAQGADLVGAGHACIGYLTIRLSGGAIAHIHVNWLSPTKIRTIMIGGSKRMVVWDDLHPTQRLSIYDKGVELAPPTEADARRAKLTSYRVGDIVAPALPEVEALQMVVQEFVGAITESRYPETDGESGLRVLRVLEAVSRSVRRDGITVQLNPQRVAQGIAE